MIISHFSICIQTIACRYFWPKLIILSKALAAFLVVEHMTCCCFAREDDGRKPTVASLCKPGAQNLKPGAQNLKPGAQNLKPGA